MFPASSLQPPATLMAGGATGWSLVPGNWKLFSEEPEMIAAYTTELRRLRRATTGKQAAFSAALVVFILIILVAAPQAQQPPQYAAAATAVPPPSTTPDGTTEIDLLVGRSTVVNVGSSISRVSLTVPDIADAMVTAPTQLLIHGKQPGTISLFVWDRGGAIKTYEVKVRRDLSALGEQMLQLFPGEQISVVGSGKDVVISGTVSSKYVIEKAGDVAGGYVEKKENVVNLLKQQEGVASNQVMLRVRFAEVSRSALQELGVNLNAHGFKNDWYGRSTTQQFASGQLDEEGRLVFSDFLNLFVFNAKEGLGGVVRALQNKGLFQSLAEPNLIATNGKEASFLAGGEFPIPVVQSGAGANSVTIMFKEFGIRLNFTPTVLGGDLINLKGAAVAGRAVHGRPVEDTSEPHAVRRVAALPRESVAAVAAQRVGGARAGGSSSGSRREASRAPGRTGERAACARAAFEYPGPASGPAGSYRARDRVTQARRGDPASCSARADEGGTEGS
ncbi:MAG: pilus assembly protein N-terminal domain-containing protein [Acidobacteria bacterium]|nr:pilus assembly protein N-terminal domain-containing protein [Acidobacteriota bacterium]